VDQHKSGDKPSDMGPRRDAARVRRHQQLGNSLENLDREPEPDKDNGRQFEKVR
jgi:hypothetical protein